MDQYIGWSMSKSIIGLLVGIALDEGDITSMQDTVVDYAPEFRGTPFAEVSIEQMLRMRAGTSYTEGSLLGGSDLMTLAERSLYTNKARFTDVSPLELIRTSGPGEEFNYSTLTTSVLGRVLEEATGKSVAAYLEEKIWQPAGMASDGYWLTDGPKGEGHIFSGGGVNARARDFARLGLLVADGGSYQGE